MVTGNPKRNIEWQKRSGLCSEVEEVKTWTGYRTCPQHRKGKQRPQWSPGFWAPSVQHSLYEFLETV